MSEELKNNTYTQMQQRYYDGGAKVLLSRNRDLKRFDEAHEWVVGPYYYHNDPARLAVYENLFNGIDKNKMKKMVALDFGCGPGRNILVYKDRFKRIDGTDISQYNLNNFLDQIKEENIDIDTNLYKCNGYDLDIISDKSYDLIMSLITLQHISIHAIRHSYFKDFFRVLKDNGILTFQMAFGDIKKGPGVQVDYFSNDFSIPITNGSHDVRIDDPNVIINELKEIGFVNITHKIVDVDINHNNHMIFVQAHKEQ